MPKRQIYLMCVI